MVSYYCEFLSEPNVILTEDINDEGFSESKDAFIYVTTNPASKREDHFLNSIYDCMKNRKIEFISNFEEILPAIEKWAQFLSLKGIGVDQDCVFIGVRYYDFNSVSLSLKLVDLENLTVDIENSHELSDSYIENASKLGFYIAVAYGAKSRRALR